MSKYLFMSYNQLCPNFGLPIYICYKSAIRVAFSWLSDLLQIKKPTFCHQSLKYYKWVNISKQSNISKCWFSCKEQWQRFVTCMEVNIECLLVIQCSKILAFIFAANRKANNLPNIYLWANIFLWVTINCVPILDSQYIFVISQ